MEIQTAKIFQNGRSQAIRLPKEFRFDGKEVFIEKVGEKIILSPKPSSWNDFFLSGEKADPDFMEDRKDIDLKERHMFDD